MARFAQFLPSRASFKPSEAVPKANLRRGPRLATGSLSRSPAWQAPGSKNAAEPDERAMRVRLLGATLEE